MVYKINRSQIKNKEWINKICYAVAESEQVAFTTIAAFFRKTIHPKIFFSRKNGYIYNKSSGEIIADIGDKEIYYNKWKFEIEVMQ